MEGQKQQWIDFSNKNGQCAQGWDQTKGKVVTKYWKIGQQTRSHSQLFKYSSLVSGLTLCPHTLFVQWVAAAALCFYWSLVCVSCVGGVEKKKRESFTGCVYSLHVCDIFYRYRHQNCREALVWCWYDCIQAPFFRFMFAERRALPVWLL